jgi:hypothetical protein
LFVASAIAMRAAAFSVKAARLSCTRMTESAIGKAAAKWSISVGFHSSVAIWGLWIDRRSRSVAVTCNM